MPGANPPPSIGLLGQKPPVPSAKDSPISLYMEGIKDGRVCEAVTKYTGT
ncbi:hypothetical protein ABWH92_02855 [Ahrensia marina]